MPNTRRAIVSLITMTGVDAAVSCGVKARPRTTRIPSVRKKSGVTTFHRAA